MVGFGLLAEPWTATVASDGALELRWRDRNQGHWYGFRTGANIIPNSAVSVTACDTSGAYVHIDDPNLRYPHFGVRTNDGHFWVGWIDLQNWGAGLSWEDQTFAGTTGQWLTGPDAADHRYWVDLAGLTDEKGNPLPKPSAAA